uniref:Purple acid phosphatase n=2 Tax=Oryza TaxID=4527 RepID=A0A0E0MCI6_ORYPU
MASPRDRGDTRKKLQITVVFLIRTVLLACIIARRVLALIRVVCRVAVVAPARSLVAVAGAVFSAVNARCAWCLDQAALGRSCTGTLLGDAVVAAMASSWRLLLQGLTSLVFLCAHADEYVRPPPSPLVLTPHGKPALHPQQVHISIVGEKNMRISWVTDDLNAPSVVEYGTSPGKYTASATGDHTTYRYFFYKSGAIHHVTIGPLDASTTYYYRCGKAGDEFTLRTPPAKLPVEFVVIGDLGQTKWTASTLSHIGGGGDYDMLLLPGDLSYADTQQPLWDTFGRLVQPLASARPWMVTEGNHEIEALPVVGFAPFTAYNARWRMPHEESGSPSNLYYSFDAAGGAAHVVMLGSYAEFEEGSPQRAWLERDLAGVDRRRTPWLVALVHAPWYNTNEAHQGEGERMRRAMESLLYEARVDVVFSGHVHAYERFVILTNPFLHDVKWIYDNEADSRGPMYITIGDGGNREGLALKFMKGHKSAHLSEFREASFGHGRLRIVNETTAVWTWHRNDDQFATVRDEIWAPMSQVRSAPEMDSRRRRRDSDDERGDRRRRERDLDSQRHRRRSPSSESCSSSGDDDRSHRHRRDESSRRRQRDQSRRQDRGGHEERRRRSPQRRKEPTPPLPPPPPILPEMILGRTGGIYIPPFRMAQMMREVEDKSSAEYQRLSWDALKKSINGLVNKVNATNIKNIVPELFAENLVRGRGLFCQSCIKSQMASPGFTDVFAALVAIVNTKFPEIGRLLLVRVVLQLKRAYKRNDKPQLLAATKFIAHLVNQVVAHELVALELLTVLLENPTDDSVEVAVGFVKECGAMLQDLSPQGLHAIFERFRGILHEGEIDKRVQFLIEGLFAIRKAKFQGFPAIRPELDLVEQEDQFTHEISLEDELDPETNLNVFRANPNFAEDEKEYENLKRSILGAESSDEEDGSDDSSDEDAEEESDDEEDDEQMEIRDQTETNLINLRRTIYLTIMSSVDFEEAGHKLLKIKLEPGQEMELCIMLLECCSQERTYLRYYGLLGQRFCMINKVYQENFEKCFVQQYSMIHRLETNKLRNVAKFFAHLLGTDALPWHVLAYIRLTEEDTTSSSRIFIKILFQELSEHLGIRLLNERLNDPNMQDSFDSVFPKDHPKNTRFSINFFTSIGLGGITETLREYLKNMPRLIMQQQKPASSESDSSDSGSGSDSYSSESESSSDESDRKRRKRRKK